MKRVLITASLLVLSACVSDEEAAKQRFANIQRSCKQMGYTSGTELANCEQSMAILTQEVRAERAARVEAAGQALTNAGAALSSINPTSPIPPPTIERPIQCSTSANGRSTTCF